MEINIHEAKTHLSRLIERAVAGEEVIIAKAGRPLVRLTRIDSERPVLGSASGLIRFEPGWDAPLSDDEMDRVFGR